MSDPTQIEILRAALTEYLTDDEIDEALQLFFNAATLPFDQQPYLVRCKFPGTDEHRLHHTPSNQLTDAEREQMRRWGEAA